MSKTAILIDGGFYNKRAEVLFGKQAPELRVKTLIEYCYKHLSHGDGKQELYRIFYYDCPPIDKKVLHPMTGENINYKNLDKYREATEFLELMKQQRKVAIRLGKISGNGSNFIIPDYVVKKLFDKNNPKSFESLKPSDLKLNVRQKGVDMRIGVDIASLAYKKQVDQIVLIAGDSDFVPVGKVARREGIDFILDPMWNHLSSDLSEHIDGLFSPCENPAKKKER